MKLKLIQLTVLFAFVVSIVMLAPPDEGLGRDPSFHVPDLWINSDGDYETPDNPGYDLINKTEDPRGKNFNKVCGSPGDEFVSGLAWYYRGGKLSDSSGHEKEKDPKKKESREHISTYKQNVYKIYLDGFAKTSATEASGRLEPGIEHAESIELSTAHSQETFKGQGRITLEIPEMKYHVPQYRYYGFGRFKYYRGCKTKISDEYYFKPNADSVLKVIVNIENVREKRTGSIMVGGEFKGASSSFIHSWEWEKSWFKTRGRGFGMEASLGGSYRAFWYPEIKLQGKTAEVYGNVEDARLPILNAEYDTKKSWCPPDSSGTSSDYVPHL